MKLTAARFARLADEAVGDLLAEHEFEPTSKEDLGGAYSRTYRSGERYICVTASTQWRDEGPHCQAHLGEGPDTWPEKDWNAVALWRLIGEPRHYPISGVEKDDIAEALRSFRDDLERHASDFLRGEVERFRDVLVAQNEDREPYRIHRPGKDGTYTASVDPESAELKARYSRGAG